MRKLYRTEAAAATEGRELERLQKAAATVRVQEMNFREGKESSGYSQNPRDLREGNDRR